LDIIVGRKRSTDCSRPLSGSSSSAFVTATLGAQPRPGLSLSDSAIEYLRGKNLLLVLDNCEHLVDVAGPNSHRRPFLDCGSAVQVLLEQRIRWGTAYRSFAGELLAAFRKRAPSVAVTRAELLEPLSGREQSVLRFLPTMMSNAEIAGELFVTSNTVKTHLKSIYRKLAVSRRRDAVERARELELL